MSRSLPNSIPGFLAQKTWSARALQLALALTLVSVPASAANASFTGSFAADDNLAVFTFNLTSISTVTIRTYSYGGGLNSASQNITDGGFDPVVTLFAGLGPTAAYLSDNNDGTCPPLTVDPVGGACWDSYLQIVGLTPGDYTVVLTQAPNIHGGTVLGDPFPFDGQGNFTGSMFGTGSESFLDAVGRQRTSAWALDILNVDSATGPNAIPEPSSLALFSGAVLALAYARSRRG